MADDNQSERPVHIQGTANINQATSSEATGVKIERVTGNVHVHGDTTPPPSFRSVALVGVLAFLGAVLVNIATSQLPPGLQPYLWLSWPLALLVTAVSIWVAYRQSRSTSSSITVGSSPSERNRTVMLDKVENFWIKGVLEQSLYQIARLELGLKQAPEKIDHPWQTVLQRPTTSRVVPAGTPVIKLFDDLDGKLLILGAPGAGKTTLLLELAHDLIARARSDPQQPIPVVFNLSTWASKRQVLDKWLVGELNERYDVPRKLAQEWVEADAILPLLDGLDEVAIEQRDACVEAINAYRRERGLVSLAVCSRVEDYGALANKLRLQGAVVIQPLTHATVDTYLRQVGVPLIRVRAALRDDPALSDLLDSPLLLSIVALAYKDKSPSKLRTSGTLEMGRWQLFEDYIKAMFERMGRSTNTTPYAQPQTKNSLTCLAKQMIADQQSVFYIERIQSNWLPQEQKRSYSLNVFLFSGLCTGLFCGVSSGLLFRLSIQHGLEIGLLLGLTCGFASGLASLAKSLQVTEAVHWSWSHNLLTGGLAFGLITMAFLTLINGLVSGLVSGIGLGIIAGLYFGLRSGEITVKTAPNQGIYQAAGSSLLVMLIFSFLFSLLGVFTFGIVGGPAHGLGSGLGFGVITGTICGLKYGGYVVFRHYTLRWMLYRNGSLPLRLVPFLDYCAERIFLRKVGGGYIFVHRLLMEHFASLNTAQPAAEPVEAQETTP